MDMLLTREKELLEQISLGAEKMQATILHTERNIKRLRQQVDTVKATESVQRAQEAVALRHTGSETRIATAMDSLKRIKEKQALKEATMAVADELDNLIGESLLQQRLKEAGISTSETNADDVLAKIKLKHQSPVK